MVAAEARRHGGRSRNGHERQVEHGARAAVSSWAEIDDVGEAATSTVKRGGGSDDGLGRNQRRRSFWLQRAIEVLHGQLWVTGSNWAHSGLGREHDEAGLESSIDGRGKEMARPRRRRNGDIDGRLIVNCVNWNCRSN
ncbi:hypothetical protein M0R45_000412 [Rubus argutus]|uniref:Uncharacterized protein n=1 Tax=Rubus argutus TaxID=59490 RepID=A0AAW1VMW6_RUBAR